MFSVSGGDKQVTMNLRYKDFFIDFLACLIPGFVFFVLSSSVIASTIYLFFKLIPYSGKVGLFFSIDDVLKLKDIFFFQFWLHASILIISFMFGFFLYRQDPKKPDHVSYLKNRKIVQGYNEWVIKNTEGLHPSEVQFPYCNLSAYLSSRGFNYSKDIINWKCDKKKTDSDDNYVENSQKNRSKAFINKLKMRLSFFYPEAMSTIIKNEAHIRFSSSMWYGFSVVIKLLYFTILILLVFENIILFKHDNTFIIIASLNIFNAILLIGSIFVIKNKCCDSKIYEEDHKQKKEEIDKQALCLTNIYRIYDMYPLVSLMTLILPLYVCVYYNFVKGVDYFYLLLVVSCFLSVISFFVFYAKQKIEMSFHYQRVREIVYVIEVANMAKVILDSDVQELIVKREKSGIAQQIIQPDTGDQSDF